MARTCWPTRCLPKPHFASVVWAGNAHARTENRADVRHHPAMRHGREEGSWHILHGRCAVRTPGLYIERHREGGGGGGRACILNCVRELGGDEGGTV